MISSLRVVALFSVAAGLCAPARAVEFQDPAVLSAGPAGVVVRAHRGDVAVPGLGTVTGAYLYDIGATSGMPSSVAPVGIMPPVIAAPRGATLGITFQNDLDVFDALQTSHPSVSNLHTHGLIVSPAGVGFGGAGSHRYGDCVFVTASAPGGASGPSPRVDPCAPASGPAPMAEEARTIAYSYPIASDHPSGLYWIHPHAHRQSEGQVSNGLGALLTVGSLWDYSYIDCRVTVSLGDVAADTCRDQEAQQAELAREAAASAPGGAVHVRYLALKDIQVRQTGSDPQAFSLIEFPKRPDEAAPGVAPPPDAGKFDDANNARKSVCGQLDLGATLKDDLVYDAPPSDPSGTFGHGRCWASDAAKSDLWAFTVSGQVYPHLAIAPGTVEVWRLANTSADVTYRLRLETTGEAKPRRLAMTVRALDGVAAPAERPVQEIVLMPSARVEVLVERCTRTMAPATCADPAHRVEARLRTAGVATGIKTPLDPDKRDGDQWPPIDLATVTFEPAAGAPAAASAPALRVAVPRAVQAASTIARKAAPSAPSPEPVAPEAAPQTSATPAPCKTARYDSGPRKFRESDSLVRFVRLNNHDFSDVGGSELFGIHVENRNLHDVAGRVVSVADLVDDGKDSPVAGRRSLIARLSVADRCHDENGGLTAGDFALFYPAFDMMGEPSVRAYYGGVEYWLVVNDSRECHNFHIHQMKFTVLDADVVVNVDGDHASQDQCLGDRRLTPPIAQSALHDNYPIPPGARVLFRLTFDGPKLGRFVFHCHILEHEDKGMMASIEVVSPPP